MSFRLRAITAITIAAQIVQQMDNPFNPSSKLTAWQIPPLTMMVMITEIRLTLVSNLRPEKST
jgi:glucose-6-phosphate-specific signal transduction histidine kinase